MWKKQYNSWHLDHQLFEDEEAIQNEIQNEVLNFVKAEELAHKGLPEEEI